jgi:Tfp pilus assembly protein PilW
LRGFVPDYFEVKLGKMNDQTQNVKPDFSFITQQPQLPPKKGIDKKVLIIAGLLGFLIVLLVASVFLSAKNKVTTVSGSTGPKTAVQNYLKAVNAEQYDKAYGYFSTSAGVNKQQFTSMLGRYFKASNDIAACEVSQPDSTKPNAVQVVCPYAVKTSKTVYRYDMVSKNNSYVIEKVTLIKQEAI